MELAFTDRSPDNSSIDDMNKIDQIARDGDVTQVYRGIYLVVMEDDKGPYHFARDKYNRRLRWYSNREKSIRRTKMKFCGNILKMRMT